MRQIGRELQGEQRVIQIQMLADVLPQRRIGGQFQQAAMVFGEFEFARRAQHALAFHAAQLADLDDEGFAVFTGRQLGTDERAGNADADARIGCAADDVEQLSLADIDLADAQTVGIGMLLGFLDFAHHDMGKGRCHGLEFFDLQTGHGQRFSELCRAHCGVAESA